jgi:hypothetical protein
MPNGKTTSQAQTSTDSSALTAEPSRPSGVWPLSAGSQAHAAAPGTGADCSYDGQDGVRDSPRTASPRKRCPCRRRRRDAAIEGFLFYCGPNVRKIVSLCAIAASDGSVSRPGRNLRYAPLV